MGYQVSDLVSDWLQLLRHPRFASKALSTWGPRETPRWVCLECGRDPFETYNKYNFVRSGLKNSSINHRGMRRLTTSWFDVRCDSLREVETDSMCWQGWVKGKLHTPRNWFDSLHDIRSLSCTDRRLSVSNIYTPASFLVDIQECTKFETEHTPGVAWSRMDRGVAKSEIKYLEVLSALCSIILTVFKRRQ